MTANIPDHLSYFYREHQALFEVLSDLNEEEAEAILKDDVLWRGDGTYLRYRTAHEGYLRDRFVEKGGAPKRQYPIYMILGDSPTGPHSLDGEYDRKLVIPLSLFGPEDISYTYPDSLYKVPLEDPGRLYLDRDPAPDIYRVEEIGDVIEKYRIFEFNNHYIEAQVWVDEPLNAFRETAAKSADGCA